ncbi:MAG: AAA-type ATPase lid domain-containing protein [Eubacteriales bacterium]
MCNYVPKKVRGYYYIKILWLAHHPHAEGVYQGLILCNFFIFSGIIVPPLRERREDILALAFVFLMQFNKKYGLNKKYTSVVLEKFLRYSWPGNVRQLENTIHRLVIMTDADWLIDVDLQIYEDKQNFDILDSTSLKNAVEKLEVELIEKALEKYHDPEKAASSLGIHRTTLIRKKHKNKKLS